MSSSLFLKIHATKVFVVLLIFFTVEIWIYIVRFTFFLFSFLSILSPSLSPSPSLPLPLPPFLYRTVSSNDISNGWLHTRLCQPTPPPGRHLDGSLLFRPSVRAGDIVWITGGSSNGSYSLWLLCSECVCVLLCGWGLIYVGGLYTCTVMVIFVST